MNFSIITTNIAMDFIFFKIDQIINNIFRFKNHQKNIDKNFYDGFLNDIS